MSLLKRIVPPLGLICWMVTPGWVMAQTATERITEAADLGRPVFVTAPAGDSDRLFIAEQHSGRIEILDRTTGAVMNTAFLDLGGLSTGNEQGLLGLAFDPDYANNGFFYVNVTTSADGGDTHIRRYHVQGDPATSNVADAGSQFEILSFNQPQSNHNGGWIGFGPNDGYLYIASGDGGGGNDDDGGHTANIGNGQDLTNNWLGKMLRVDVHSDAFTDDANRNYAIPDSNPFVNQAGDGEIWAYGLRNPYRSSFDRATGDLWIGDVGQGRKEEIDFQPATSPGGENYGWLLREGTIETPGVGGNPPLGHIEPIYDYDHLTGVEPDPDFRGNVVIGGYVYRGPVAALQGHYLFSDAGSANIWKLDPEAVDPRASVTRINDLLLPDAGSVGGLSSFGEDDDGNLYLMELSGEIFRVTTGSKDVVWNGDDASVGAAGDGVSWGSANNWTRGGSADQSFVAEDAVIFAAGSSQSEVSLDANRTVSGVTFQAAYTLQDNTLRVLSGNVTVDAGVTATIASTLEAESQQHSLRKLGNGTLLVDGTAGQTVAKSGTLGGDGSFDYLTVEAGATVAPGASVGTLEIVNSLLLKPGSTLAIELAGTAFGQFDQLLVGGTTSLGGKLAVELLDDFVPQAGNSFGFLAAIGGAGGMFSTLDLPMLGPNLEWLINPGGVTVSLLVNSTLEADFDNDVDVDLDDLRAWEQNFGSQGGAGRSQGDADGDFDVDGADFLRWQQQYTGNLGVVSSPNSIVPEPATGIMLVLGMMVMPFRQRRKSILRGYRLLEMP